jgi:hypothetical protein
MARRLLAGFLATTALVSPAVAVDFAHEVVPILRKHCGECHTGDKKKGGFSMNTRASLLEGSENGAVLAPGRADHGRLLEVIISADPDERMPPKGDRLSPTEVTTLRKWVATGAPWTEGFAFKQPAYEPPLRPRQPVLPEAKAGRTHPVDRVLDGWLAAKGVPTPAPADDATFQRRVMLDLVGLLPSAEEARAFAADRHPDKRAALVRAVLARDVDYADHWMVFWNDLLRNDYAGTGYIDGGRKQITHWLYLSLLTNKPYDRFTRELVAPTADSEGFAKGIIWRGAVSAGQVPELQYAQSVSQTFLGINMKCASCHDSFVDRWKLSDAYGLAAVFADRPMELVRCDIPTGKTAAAAWPFPELGQVDAAKPRAERLAQLAGLVTHPENGRFQRTIVNRLWHRLMGRGVVHPTDAMDTPPWSQDLLDVLAARLVESQYDLKATLAFIATSQAYQSRAEVLAGDADDKGYVYRGPRAKRLTAEQFVDAVWRLTGTTPAKIELKVPRAAPTVASVKKPIVEPLIVAPIWSGDIAAGRLPAAGETRSFRRQLVLDADVESAVCVITCDNGFELYVNGKKIGAGDNWAEPQNFDLSPVLLKGANQIVVVGRNAGAGPNLAALFFQANVTLKGGARVKLASDASWEWTTSVPNARGVFGAPFAGKTKTSSKAVTIAWQPVSLVKSAAWGAALIRMAEMLAGVDGTSSLPARAGLMKSDLLQRALGRPNREQIVSMRPNELSTLEAIDLSNGQALTNLLAAGAAKLKKRSWSSPEDLARWLYLSALSREPAPAELKVAAGIVGAEMTEQGIADLLWAVCMLPEFQTIR